MLFCRFRNPWGDAAEMVEEPVREPRGALYLGCPTHVGGAPPTSAALTPTPAAPTPPRDRILSTVSGPITVCLVSGHR